MVRNDFHDPEPDTDTELLTLVLDPSTYNFSGQNHEIGIVVDGLQILIFCHDKQIYSYPASL